MSTWRDIWRYGVIANRLYAENETNGEEAFNKLFKVYGNDGMIHYLKAEAYELAQHKEKALKEYKKARKLFPVPHWKQVAKDSYDRLKNGKTPIEFYGILDIYKILSDENAAKSLKDEEFQKYFKNLLWFGFQNVYAFTYLNDFARYVCLSALSRGSSEWPLSLVDFRTVLELEIKQCFSKEIQDEFKDANTYSLRDIIDKLYELSIIDEEEKKAFDNIRKAGNIAAHELYGDNKYKFQNVDKFISVLLFFNEYRKTHNIPNNPKIKKPLNQMTLEEFNKELDKKA